MSIEWLTQLVPFRWIVIYSVRFTYSEVPKKTLSRFFQLFTELVSKVPSTQQKRKPKNQQGCQVGKWFVANLRKYQRLYGGDTMHHHTDVCKSSQIYGTISFRSLWTHHLQTLVKLPKALSPAAVSMDIRFYCCISKVEKAVGGRLM